MIDTAHGLGMMVFLDVVYNHFGPDGNYLGAYAPAFFRDDVQTPWGQAIDFRQRAVRDYFTENAIYWLNEFRFDGLRFDAVHAISEKDWLVEMAQQVRSRVIAGRHIHLVLENDENLAYLLEGKPDRLFDAQWNDDIHHAYHVLLTGENEGYYAGYSDRPSGRLARGLAEGFIYQGEAALYPGAEPRGERSSHLPPTAFVDFLQNHDQIGNRAFGERLTTLADPHALRAAMAMLLLSPHIPMLFMGDEIGARQPFLYFTSHPDLALANAVRDGRRQEFARFAAFSDPEKRALIPDPNAESTFFASLPKEDDSAPYWRRWVKTLLEIRHRDIMPRLANARSFGAQALGSAGVLGRWMMGDGSVLSLSVNLDRQPVAVPTAASPDKARLLFETEGAANCARQGELPAHAMLALLEPAP
jgi:maltooligosyltrehalose trehalohydrolase